MTSIDVDCDFDEDQVRAAEQLWEHYQSQLSELEREKIVFEAKELTECLFGAYHATSGWCGDIFPENFKAAWKLVAVALVLRLHKHKRELRA